MSMSKVKRTKVLDCVDELEVLADMDLLDNPSCFTSTRQLEGAGKFDIENPKMSRDPSITLEYGRELLPQ